MCAINSSNQHALVEATAAAGLKTGPGGDAAGYREEPDDRNSFDHMSKGSTLLKRMGWTEGQGLGRQADGKLEPVQARKYT